MVKWTDISYAHHSTKAKALRSMRGHRDDTEKSKRYQWRVHKQSGRTKPWGKKSMGWQVQFRRKKKGK